MNKLIIILLLAVLGCQSSEPDESMTEKTKPTSSTIASAENDLFSVHISVPKQVKANEAFSIDVELKNKTQREVAIMSGEPVFYYDIRDSNGNSINTVARTDVGVVRPMAGKEVISEKHSYQFKKLGIYEVSAVADFPFKVETAARSTKWKRLESRSR